MQVGEARIDLEAGTIWHGGERTQLTPQVHRLLVFFANHPGEVLSRERLLVEVWGYAASARTRAADTTVRRLRTLLEENPEDPRHIVTVHGEGYRFLPPDQPIAPDLVLGDCTVSLARLKASWADGRTMVLSAQETGLLRSLAAASGRPVSRALLLRTVWHNRSGRSTRAVDNAVMRLRTKIEVDPKRPVFLQTVRGAGYLLKLPVPEAPAAPALSAKTAAPPLPVQRTPLVGRAAVLSQLRQMFLEPGLVTLQGTGGIGKTRLALAAAHGGARSAFFCDLSEATTTSAMIHAIARGVDVRRLPLSEDKQVAELGQQLSEVGDALLVLDNLEQLLEPIQRLLPAWLDAAPRLRVLATSRRRLKLDRERVIALPPLDEGAARALFAARYAAAGGSLAGTSDEQEAIDALAARLDRLPLAIELAAARGRLMRPAALLARLEQRPGLLRQAQRPERHTTLEAAIGWSWSQLSPEEQQALARVTVFAGGFSLEAAEAVLPDGVDTLAVLESLLDHSLIVPESPPELPGDARFRLLVTIRDYAAARLSDAERAEAHARHARHYARSGQAWFRQLRRIGRAETFHRLRLENDNLLAAVERCHEALPDEAGWCLFAAVRPLRSIRNRAAATRYVSALRGRVSERVGLRLSLLTILDQINARQVDAAVQSIQAGLAVAARIGDPLAQMELLRLLGTSQSSRHRYQEAHDAFLRCALIAEQHGVSGWQAMMYVNAGAVAHALGEPAGSRRLLQDAVHTIGDGDGFVLERGMILSQVGNTLIQQGGYREGIYHLQRAEPSLLLRGAAGSVSSNRSTIAIAQLLSGQPAAARETIETMEVSGRHLSRLFRSYLPSLKGLFYLADDDLVRAEALFLQSDTLPSLFRSINLVWWAVCDAVSGRTGSARKRLLDAQEARLQSPYSHPECIAFITAWFDQLEAPDDPGRAERCAARRAALEAASRGGERLVDGALGLRLLLRCADRYPA